MWWFYLFWLPRYVTERYNLTLSKTSAPILTVYAMSSIGSIAGGWLSGSMIKRGKSVNVSRKTAMGICAIAVVPVLYAPYAHDLWLMVFLVGLAMAAHQGWSANAFTLTSDLFPRAAVASVVGIGGMVGAIGGVLMQLAARRYRALYLSAALHLLWIGVPDRAGGSATAIAQAAARAA